MYHPQSRQHVRPTVMEGPLGYDTTAQITKEFTNEALEATRYKAAEDVGRTAMAGAVSNAQESAHDFVLH